LIYHDVKDLAPKLMDKGFLRVPYNGSEVAVTITRNPFKETDILCWYITNLYTQDKFFLDVEPGDKWRKV